MSKKNFGFWQKSYKEEYIDIEKHTQIYLLFFGIKNFYTQTMILLLLLLLLFCCFLFTKHRVVLLQSFHDVVDGDHPLVVDILLLDYDYCYYYFHKKIEEVHQ